MSTQFEMLAEHLLTCLTTEKTSNAIVHEFLKTCYQIIQNVDEVPWGGAVEALWNYLDTDRTSPESMGSDVNAAFQRGQLFAALKLIKMTQERETEKIDIADDAKEYSRRWRPLFAALQNGNSLTHKELADICNISDSVLSQFLSKIEPKHYIQCRKVGRTKYYRLSAMGQKLLLLMPKPGGCKNIRNKHSICKASVSNQ